MVSVRGNLAEFRFFRPSAKCVQIVGDFNNWRPDQLRMQLCDDGWWQARLMLPPGTYRFRYNADGQWFTDYAAFGIEYGPFGQNSLLRVASNADTTAA